MTRQEVQTELSSFLTWLVEEVQKSCYAHSFRKFLEEVAEDGVSGLTARLYGKRTYILFSQQ